MENDDLNHRFWWRYDTSGDWLTLDDAADRLTIELQTTRVRTASDILKAGYISYLGVDDLLPLYVPVKQERMLRIPPHLTETASPVRLPMDHLLLVGDFFQMHPGAIEKLVLLGSVESTDMGAIAHAVILSDEAVPGWDEQVDWIDKRRSWSKDFNFCIYPNLQVRADDVRVDGESLCNFIEALRRIRPISNADAPIPSAPIDILHNSEERFPWCVAARRIATEILTLKPHLKLERISELTSREMEIAHAKGEPGMTGRGSKIPSAGSIKRHALKGLAAKA